MSWFSDVTGINIDFNKSVEAIANDFGSVFRGGNVLDALKNAATTFEGITLEATNPTYALAASGPGQDLLRSKGVSGFTGGISNDIAGFSETIDDTAKGKSLNDLSSQERDEFLRTMAMAAAVTGGAALAPSLIPGSAQAVAGDLATVRATEGALQKGNLLDAGLAVGSNVGGSLDDTGTASDLIGGAQAVSGIVQAGQPKKTNTATTAPGATVAQPAPTTAAIQPQPGSTNIGLPLVIAAAVLLKVLK